MLQTTDATSGILLIPLNKSRSKLLNHIISQKVRQWHNKRLTDYTIISTQWIIGHQGVKAHKVLLYNPFSNEKQPCLNLHLWDPSTSTLDFQRLAYRVQVGMDEPQGKGGGKEE